MTPKNEEATVLEVDVGKDQKGKVVMAPGDGQTRYDQVLQVWLCLWQDTSKHNSCSNQASCC